MTIQDKKEQIINDYYCHDSYAESCDCDCDYCKDEIKKDIDELEKSIRADAIDECIKITDECCWRDAEMLVELFKELKEKK